MFCPDCGAENSRNQKFCTRCGTNLVAIDRAREIFSEIEAKDSMPPSVPPSSVLGYVSLICFVGFITITIGTVQLSFDLRMSIFFALGGFTTLIMVCYYMLQTLRLPEKPPPRNSTAKSVKSVAQGVTNRALGESATPFKSVIEDTTRQFEAERNSPF